MCLVIEEVLGVYHTMRKYEPAGLSYFEHKVFDALCQEYATEIVRPDEGDDYFRDTYLVDQMESIEDGIFTLLLKMTGMPFEGFTWNTKFYVRDNDIHHSDIKLCTMVEEIDWHNAINEMSLFTLDTKEKLKTKFLEVIPLVIDFDAWLNLVPDVTEIYPDYDKEEAEEMFQSHLKYLKLLK